MANSYLDLQRENYIPYDLPIGFWDHAKVFPFDFNWVEPLETNFLITRYMIGSPGGPTSIEQKNKETPIMFKGQVMIHGELDTFIFLSFIHRYFGNVRSFWVKYPKVLFTLKEIAYIDNTSIIVESNGFDLIHCGYERIYIEMNDGDILTRQVTELDVDGDSLTLHLKSPLDREINFTNHFRIGRFLFGRFESNSFSLTLETNNLFSTEIMFHELVKGYPS